jgi:hypothetical protein
MYRPRVLSQERPQPIHKHRSPSTSRYKKRSISARIAMSTINSPQGCRVRSMPAPCGTRVKADDTQAKQVDTPTRCVVGKTCMHACMCLFITYSNSVTWSEAWFWHTAYLPSDRRSHDNFFSAWAVRHVQNEKKQAICPSRKCAHGDTATITYSLASNFFSESPKA